MSFFDFHFGASFLAALAIVAGAFVSEDAATITAATLAAASLLDVRLSFVSAVVGLWVGDLGVYGVVRLWKEKARQARWFLHAEDCLQSNGSRAGGGWPL